MKLLITGCCGFVGSRLIEAFTSPRYGGEFELYGIDNLSRPGSEWNRGAASQRLARFWHGDLRLASDLEVVPPVDWVLDASANASVLAGSGELATSRQLIENNLLTTVNLLEYCKRHQAGMVLLSSSRVYSIDALRRLTLEEQGGAFAMAPTTADPPGCGRMCITEDFPTRSPISLYGASKLASEALALEYSAAFGFPVWIDRCGLLAGAGQFGRADQGIVAYWIHSWFEQRPLRYVGFGGHGWQVRDCLHPYDLAELIARQLAWSGSGEQRVLNVSGGASHGFSLAQLSGWCEDRFGPRPVAVSTEQRPADVPWLVLDSSRARATFGWSPEHARDTIFSEIADFAELNPNWISRTQGF
jgi:CDP-paratose 2-epimerase